jgi:hypothetical protein
LRNSETVYRAQSAQRLLKPRRFAQADRMTGLIRSALAADSQPLANDDTKRHHQHPSMGKKFPQ